jgi:hypothetical protein
MICWLVSGVSVLLLYSVGNIHGWTFTFIFPAFVSFVAGAALLSKLTDDSPRLGTTTPKS